MIQDEHLWEIQRTLSAEFSKYVLSHPEIDEQIPDGAQVVFKLLNDPKFNEWSLEVARSQREADQPAVIVEVEKFMPSVESRLVNPRLESVSVI